MAKTTRYEVEYRRDVRIPSGKAGITLAADVYLPVTAEAVPALVTCTPYRKDTAAGIGSHPTMRWYAEHGLAGVLIDMRGTGSSDGQARPPFDDSEADDAIAAITWAAHQPWCDGNVGMWGVSYGGLTTLRTASRRPPALKAIIPIVGMTDPERDFVHPGGIHGGLPSLVQWGTTNLVHQLLPPIGAYHAPEEQRRWRDRVERSTPYLLDLYAHPPGHPDWRERAVDPARIAVPALCVTGWRDLFCPAMIRAYEAIRAPKRLIVGPWLHMPPHESPFAAIDFLPIALRWWRHWLGGEVETSEDDPAVLMHVQGEESDWRVVPEWPPPSNETVIRGDLGTRRLMPPGEPADFDETAVLHPDPTVGGLGGLWSTPSGSGLPLDQHDDDQRGLAVTSDPLTQDLVIAGHPTAVLRLEYGGQGPARPLTVRLTDVDPSGRSALITSGETGGRTGEPSAYEVELTPTAYRVAAGHRLRAVIGDTDFPRHRPTAGTPLMVNGLDLTLPTTNLEGTEPLTPSPPPDHGPGLDLWQESHWTITRDPLHDAIEIAYGQQGAAHTPDRRATVETRRTNRATVRRATPEAAVMESTMTTTARPATGETITVTATTRLSATGLDVHGTVTVDGTLTLDRTWHSPPP